MVQVDMFADAQADVCASGNYRMLGDRGLAKNWRLRAWDNVDAIELSKLIEKEGRPATREEQEALMRYIGWGASEIANGVLPTSGTYGRGWAEIAKALQDLVTDEEMAAIKRGTQYAHYTPEFIARAMWRAVRRLGFDCGNVIEPGCGTGLFFSLMPASLAERSQLVGVEMDPVTARIARLVHPEAVIRQEDFTKVRLPAGADLCIGNPPFAQRSVRADDEVGRLGLSLHEYFIARSVRMLRDGGIGAFVVSRYFMDKRGSAARPYLAQMADLLGAIRLPNDAMAADAGTEVLVDVIFLRKRMAGEQPSLESWEDTDERIVNFPWHQSYENDSSNKINQMIDKVYDIWVQTSCDVFTQENGQPYAKRGGAQMIFSDLGTPSIEEKRFFSAYRWIRERLLAKGVPAEEIVFMQDYKKMSEKRRLFDAVDAGKVRILIGSSMTMGTGVNAQLRLKAEHHLDVPWLPADVEQREGRIERQGNQYGEIEIFAWALLGSMDAPMWQTLERKQRFIDMVMKGDRSVRSMEDVGAETADQYALAKAISSGDERLMRKAGLEAEIGRLRRLKSAHIDDKIAVRREIEQCKLAVTTLEGQAKNYRQDLDALQPFHDDDGFHMTVDGVEYRDWIEEIEEDGKVKKIEHNARREAGSALMKILRTMEVQGGDYARTVGSIGGFDLTAEASPVEKEGGIAKVALYIEQVVPFQVTFNGATPYHHLLGKIENRLLDIQHQLEDAEWKLSKFGEKLANYENRTFGEFEFAGELALKEAELAELDKSLEASERAANDDSEAEAAA